MRKLSNRELAEVENIEKEWKVAKYLLHTSCRFTGKLTHPYPNYLYRLNGTWTGWNLFLGTPKKSFQFKIHERLDVLEDLAFKNVCG
ncbi:MAG: hypothetical protein COA86_16125 [Kangiella sp.]|nr:MAG: hypothetical protein COA86_16125 [Kangiella sp.]